MITHERREKKGYIENTLNNQAKESHNEDCGFFIIKESIEFFSSDNY